MYLLIVLAVLAAQAFTFGDDDFTMALVGRFCLLFCGFIPSDGLYFKNIH